MNIFKSTVVAIVFALSSVGFAQSNPELADIMKTMGGHFRTVAISLRTQNIDENTLLAAQGLSEAILEAKNHFPAKANTDELKQNYLNLLDELHAKSLELEGVVGAGDLGAMMEVFSEMNEIRVIGHELKPDED